MYFIITSLIRSNHIRDPISVQIRASIEFLIQLDKQRRWLIKDSWLKDDKEQKWKQHTIWEIMIGISSRNRDDKEDGVEMTN